MHQSFLVLAAWLLTAAVALGLGLLALRWLHLPLEGIETLALSFIAGGALLSLIVFGLAATGFANRTAYGAVAAIVLAVAYHQRAFASNSLALPWRRPWFVLAAIPFGVFTGIYFLHALAPELSPDGSYYHLGFVSLYNDAGRLVKVTDNMYAHLPQALEMLFLYAFAFGRHSAASLVHLTFLAALAGAVYAFGRRTGYPAAGVVAAFAVYASPIVGWDATRAYNDVALAAAVFGSFFLVFVWEQCGADAALLPAGLLAGFAFGVKYTGFIAVVLGIGYIAWVCRRRLRLRPFALFTGCAVAALSPWVIRNWIWYGNPFSPFLNRWFPNPYIFPSFERELAALMSWPGGLSGWRAIFFEVTVRGSHVQGLLGPLFLLAPVGILSCRTPAGRRLCAGALLCLSTYPTNIGTRFLIPALPFVALAMALVASKSRPALAVLFALHAITALPFVVDRYCAPYAMRLGPAPTLAEAFRKIPEDESLRARKAGYEVARMVDRLVPAGAGLYSFVSFPEAYSRTKGLMYFTSARANMITEILFTAFDASPLFAGKRMLSGLDPALAPVCRMDYPFAPQPLRAVRLVRTAGPPYPLWVVTDVALYDGGAEISPANVASASASTSPWYAGYAFDGSLVTLWSSREAVRPGMFLEAALSAPATVDRVSVFAPRDQCGSAARLEGRLDNGSWIVLRERPVASFVPTPGDLRARASCEVRRRGIAYLLVNEGNIAAEDFRRHAGEWGIEPIGAAENFTLYRITGAGCAPAP